MGFHYTTTPFLFFFHSYRLFIQNKRSQKVQLPMAEITRTNNGERCGFQSFFHKTEYDWDPAGFCFHVYVKFVRLEKDVKSV